MLQVYTDEEFGFSTYKSITEYCKNPVNINKQIYQLWSKFTRPLFEDPLIPGDSNRKQKTLIQVKFSGSIR